jgi:hypothetical protein
MLDFDELADFLSFKIASLTALSLLYENLQQQSTIM